MTIVSVIRSVAALAAVTLVYWLLAARTVQDLMAVDCISLPIETCRAARAQYFRAGMGMAVLLYLALMVLLGWALFRRRP